MSGRIRRSFPPLRSRAASLFRSYPFFLSRSYPSSLQSSCNSCCHRRGWWGAKDVCGSQGAPRWGRVPDKVTATKHCSRSSSSFSSSLSVFLFFVSSSTVHIPSSLSSLLAASSACILPDCLIFSFFSFAVHLLRPLSFPLPLFVAAAILRHM